MLGDCRKILVLYRQVRRRRAVGWARMSSAGALAIGGIWMKSLAFAADTDELIFTLWVFNARFAI